MTLDQLNRSQIRDFDEEAKRNATPEIFAYQVPEDRIRESGTAIDELYSNPEFTSFELQTALKLLAECVNLADQALNTLRDGKRLDSQEATLALQSRLPELFACRGLGDGYGALINSVQLALINRRGLALDEAQILAVRQILVATRKAPFIRFEKARKLIREFEKHDFYAEPLTLQFLLNFFDEP